MVNAAAGGWMGPGRTSMTAVRVPLGWSPLGVDAAAANPIITMPHTWCPAAASGPLALPLHCAHQLAASRTRLGWVGGRECIGAAGGVALFRGASLTTKNRRKNGGVPQHPTLHPRTGAPCRDTRPVQSPPTCTFTHGARVPTPGQVHGRAPWPRREATPPRQASRTMPKAQQIECTACCTWCMSWASVRDLALLAAAPARDLSPSVCPMRCAFFVLFTTM